MEQLHAPGTRPTTSSLTGQPRPASTRETVAVLIASAWLTAGLFLDGYAHEHIITGEESFFTPWHGVFYSGFLATVLAIGRIAWLRLGTGPRLRDCVPEPYVLSGLGAAVFAFGGVGDALWHTRYGFERGTEALYSPSHLVLLLGLVLIVTGPFRAAVEAPSPTVVRWYEFVLPLVSLTLAVSIVAFFAPWSLGESTWYRVAYDATTGSGEAELNAALGAELSTTVILVGAVLLVLRRWRPPLGTFALLFGSTTAMFNLVFDGSMLGIVAAILGGASADLILVPLRDHVAVDARNRTYAATASAAFTMLAAWHLLLFADGDLEWHAPFAAGTPVLASLAALALTAVAAPPRSVGASTTD